MLSSKVRRNLAIIYTILLVIFVFYVKGVLNKKDVKVIQEPVQERVEEVKEAKVTLRVQNSQSSSAYALTTTEQNTVRDLLISARDAGYVYYEIDEYIDKVSIFVYASNTLTSDPTENAEWNLYVKEAGSPEFQKIENNQVEQKLKNGAEYLLRRDD